MKTKLKRILALVVVAALIVTMIISVAVSARGETVRDEYSFELVLLEEQQALRATQRLTFYSPAEEHLDRIMLTVYPNMFRRLETVAYETEKALPNGFAPGGAEFYSVKVNGEPADWAVQGEGEYYMRVACDLEPGEKCELEFVYDLLLTDNAAFCGVDEDTWRLSNFYPQLCLYEDGRWQANRPLQHSRYTLTAPADYTARITLPEIYDLAATGDEEYIDNGDGTCTWTVRSENTREFALIAGRAWHEYADRTDLGVYVRVLSSDRAAGRRALAETIAAVELYEEYFGKFPTDSLDVAFTSLATGDAAFAGCVWLDGAETDDAEENLYRLLNACAQQYFGISVYADPSADSWMSAALCEYVTYLAWEDMKGHDAFVERLNRRAAPALGVTMPGNLYVSADAAVFNQTRYDIVVRDRGAIVFHELRVAMGRDTLIDALAGYHSRWGGGQKVTERDLLEALNTASGRDWENFLTELLFNLDEYSLQIIDLYE